MREGSNLYMPATQLDADPEICGRRGESAEAEQAGHAGMEQDQGESAKSRSGDRKRSGGAVCGKTAGQKDSVYGEDTVWQKEFEELFPYEETEDQLAAIEATKKDMESTKIMDRLICGDVGYGKTEIAIRAAFKAVQDSKQVVYLVPTTILAQQHYNTFAQRMKDFPVRVDLLCRFRTPAEQKKTHHGSEKRAGGYRDRNSPRSVKGCAV